jgi:fructose-bisphosphate aldolase class I
MNTQLQSVAKAIVAPGKGILAADESTGTANKRFAPLAIPQNEEMRRKYRELLFGTPGLGEYIGGVILYDETIRQSDSRGTPLVKVLTDGGMIPGIKVDAGTVPLELSVDFEKATDGLDGLRKRVDEYVKMGAEFAKWRAVITIDDGFPTDRCIQVNAHALSRYAAICQAGGLVPIVEPEVLMDGDHAKHSLERSFTVHERVLTEVFHELAQAGVALEGSILKPSMVIPGQKSGQKASAREIAEATVTVLMRHVPAAVAGIAFLSGGQDDVEATVNLNEINRVAKQWGAPWPLTFSYGRALQHAAITTWRGEDANIAAARAQLLHRAKMNSLAALGSYSPEAEQAKDLVAAAG